MPFGDDNVVSEVHWHVFFFLMPTIFTSNKIVLKIWSNFLKHLGTNQRVDSDEAKNWKNTRNIQCKWQWVVIVWCISQKKCHLCFNGNAFQPLKKAFLVPSNKNQWFWNENILWTKVHCCSSKNNVLNLNCSTPN